MERRISFERFDDRLPPPPDPFESEVSIQLAIGPLAPVPRYQSGGGEGRVSKTPSFVVVFAGVGEGGEDDDEDVGDERDAPTRGDLVLPRGEG